MFRKVEIMMLAARIEDAQEPCNAKIARSIADFFLHLCFSFDPTAGAFTLQAFRVMQIAGVLSIIGVGGLIAGLRVVEIVRRRAARPDSTRLASAETGRTNSTITGSAAGAMQP